MIFTPNYPKKLFAALRSRALTLVTAESLTAGGIAHAVTSIPGSSAVLWGGFIVYSNEAKTALLGVPRETIEKYGAVSRETVSSMALGALAGSGADVAVAVTGFAGPAAVGDALPAGSVWIAAAYKKNGENTLAEVRLHRFTGSRASVRRKTIGAACSLANHCLDRF